MLNFDSFNLLNSGITWWNMNCIGQKVCAVTVAPEISGGDPCLNTIKLSVEAICS
uniref:Uncharacterized protein n=1 Tax=Nelumbo nucifera TaxID=4432 RepID=A0A822ZJK7_NELNU|nr:TPA_asm: hypothetical protein HUJ06_001396 [Nelumbo nucifera]